MMIAYYMDRAAKETDTKEKAKLELQAEQLKTPMQNNIEFMQWIG